MLKAIDKKKIENPTKAQLRRNFRLQTKSVDFKNTLDAFLKVDSLEIEKIQKNIDKLNEKEK